MLIQILRLLLHRSLCRLTAALPPPNSLFRTERHPFFCDPPCAAGLYQFAALVNINLAIVNILPLPALDGEPPLAAAQPVPAAGQARAQLGVPTGSAAVLSLPLLLPVAASPAACCCLSRLPFALLPLFVAAAAAAAAGRLPCLRLRPLLPAGLPCCPAALLNVHVVPALPHPKHLPPPNGWRQAASLPWLALRRLGGALWTETCGTSLLRLGMASSCCWPFGW